MNIDRSLMTGSTTLLVLSLLREGEKYGYEIVFIDTTGWLPADHPLHPTRWGHQTVADNLIPILRKYMD